MPTVPIINKPVFEIVSFIKQTYQTLATDDASAVDSDIDDYIGKSAIDDNDDSFDREDAKRIAATRDGLPLL
ncbi:hypothetical protein FOVG_18827 [Fusarium oxysporum f. sp. pisi HDV247]|uniref:Uncharacterized protein n=1 Tax=Fusarium oxysporum f. sp. pisi HDV247 TaxID=1080344 RepID=W9NAB4_FUSOX|nr:hypothetical protein FOVG_18827 [Fusarium oxysporum f. sp. pisi HDV247]